MHGGNRTNLHLAFLFASPLLYQTSERHLYDGLEPISFKEEFDEIINGMAKIKKSFRYRYLVANENHLLECLNANMLGLHITCHGF